MCTDFRLFILRQQMTNTKWEKINTTNSKNDSIPHIQIFDDKREIKIKNVDYWDRRGYKCVVYNEKDPNECSSSVFFLRVQDKMALWWPVIGIVIQAIFLFSINTICTKSWRVKFILFAGKNLETNDKKDENIDRISLDTANTNISDFSFV